MSWTFYNPQVISVNLNLPQKEVFYLTSSDRTEVSVRNWSKRDLRRVPSTGKYPLGPVSVVPGNKVGIKISDKVKRLVLLQKSLDCTGERSRKCLYKINYETKTTSHSERGETSVL